MSENDLTSPDSSTPPATLADVLAPYAPEDFLKNDWCRSFRHLPGWQGKFSELFGWSNLNEILRQHRLEPPRLRLAFEGKPVPPETFVKYQRGKRHQASRIPRLLPVPLTEQLYRGATLVLDAVDELHDPLTRLAESLERIFHVHIQMNAYAGCKVSHGFDLHWDDHEVLILQTAGRKQWKVYRPTRLHPLAKDLVENLSPAEEPVWEGILEDGDALYIPRGWWHVALPLAEPTLHITVGISNPTGVELLAWIVEHLQTHELVRQDLPLFAGPAEQQAYADRIRAALIEACEGDLLSRFFQRYDAMAPARPRFSLPWSVSDEGLPPSETARIRITVPRPLPLQIDAARGTIEFLSQGRRWQFDRSVAPILERLMDGRSYAIAELAQASADQLDHQSVRTFIGELIVNGLAAIVADDSRNDQ
ncbi:MAG TPA: cupin domain-containing protein [Blastocatellia bacterium]|nr:cupin domain-containing protein [Blastocatellia bacterium]